MEREKIEIENVVNWKVRKFVKRDFEPIEEMNDEQETERENELCIIRDISENIIRYDRVK